MSINDKVIEVGPSDKLLIEAKIWEGLTPTYIFENDIEANEYVRKDPQQLVLELIALPLIQTTNIYFGATCAGIPHGFGVEFHASKEADEYIVSEIFLGWFVDGVPKKGQRVRSNSVREGFFTPDYKICQGSTFIPNHASIYTSFKDISSSKKLTGNERFLFQTETSQEHGKTLFVAQYS